eukprot:428400_1
MSNYGDPCLSHYTCPKGISAQWAQSDMCTKDTNPIYQEFPDAYSYFNQFPTYAVDQGWPEAFQGSDNFQTVITGTENGQKVYVSNYFLCTWYQIQTFGKEYGNLVIATDFFNELKYNMPTEYNSNTLNYFMTFFANYGTHTIHQARIGCIQGQLSEITAWNYTKFISSNLNISFAATFSLYYETDQQKQIADNFRNTCSKQYNFTAGPTIPNGNYNEWFNNCTKSPVVVQFNTEEIWIILDTNYCPSMKNVPNLSQKQNALHAAFNDYCSQYAKANPHKKLNCSGWNSTEKMPNGSIVRGFYAEATGWDEPINPYTGKRSCMDGDTAYAAFGMINPANPSETFHTSMCIYTKYGKQDPLNYFGGFYSNGTVKVTNYLNNDQYGCGVGFTDYMFMNCDEKYPNQCIEPHFCYNAKLDLDKSVIGGVFSVVESDNPSKCDANNPHTGKQNCPQGFDKYQIGTTYCGNHPGYYTTLYICLNDLYIIV